MIASRDGEAVAVHRARNAANSALKYVMDPKEQLQIQTAIEQGQILSWPNIKKMAGISAYEEVSDVTVCMIGGVPYYILNVVSPEGEAAKIALNAVDGTQEVL